MDKIKFAIGYQLQEEKDEPPFLDIIDKFEAQISEVYFPWANMASGRAPLLTRRGYVFWDGQKKLEDDLKYIKSKQIKLNLLLNSNCYGQYAVSEYLQNQVISVLEHLQNLLNGVEIVTTTSLTIAHIIKNVFPSIDIRASVNMRIGTITGMKYVSDFFDSFYLQREYNRNLGYVEMVKKWADDNHKGLYLLVNSGCLNFCSAQTYHDNMVAHEKEILETINIKDWSPTLCWNYYQNPNNWRTLLQGSWIRPEDLAHYNRLIPSVKLATRMHSNPMQVVEAYIRKSFNGNLLELFEPGFSSIISPHIIDNKKFPEDWFATTSTCKQNCHECNYCTQVLKQVLTQDHSL
ncbi:hypothetical protein M0P98_08750 [bacterium]|nr:hypothetical protein [bacterium]